MALGGGFALTDPEVRAVRVLPLHGTQVVALIAPHQTQLFSADGQLHGTLPGATDLLDSPQGWLLCGPDGLQLQGVAGLRRLDDTACTALAHTPQGVLSVGANVQLWSNQLQPLQRWSVDDAPLRELAPQLLAITQQLPQPNGPRLFPQPQRLLAADLDGDGVDEQVVLHPRLLGWIDDKLERAQPLAAWRDATAADLDGDGCIELLVLHPDQLAIYQPPCALPPPAPPPPLGYGTYPLQRWSLYGVAMPQILGGDGRLLSGRPPAQKLVSWGFGFAMGSLLGGGRAIFGGSPAVSYLSEWGHDPRRRWFIGWDAAPTFIFIGDAQGIPIGAHLSNITLGVTYGGSHLRAGPFATAGLLDAGLGLRTVLAPHENRKGTLVGVETRLTWLSTRTGQVMFLVQTSRRRRNSPRMALGPTRPGLCRRLGATLGASVGASATRQAWEFVGTDAPLDWTASPLLSVSCELGSDQRGWLLSGETAPGFRYRIPRPRGGDDFVAQQFGSLSFGPQLGGDRLRGGPIATLGFWVAGLGARLAWTPLQRHGLRQGLELRGSLLLPTSLPAGQLSLGWQIWYDPRRSDLDVPQGYWLPD